MAKIAIVDTETDPFEFDHVPEPFAVGFFDGTSFKHFWGDDCVARFFEYLDTLNEPLLIFAHNGGRFDFFFWIEKFQGKIKIINSRIVEARYKRHRFRDSFAIIPVALEEYRKDEIDYNKFTRKNRAKHRPEIVSYLRTDCVALYELVTGFFKEFGDRLTIGGTAMAQLKKFHKFESANALTDPKQYDESIRPFYFGGRTQAFASGIVRGNYKIYDVNSMYPTAMRDFQHPLSTRCHHGSRITKKTDFAVIEADNYGALAVRNKEGIDFTQESGIFHATIHEIIAGEETGTLKIKRVLETFDFQDKGNFAEFVDHFYLARKAAKQSKDKIHDIFYKLILNSAYGKFAQNPEKFEDYQIVPYDTWLDPPWCIQYEFANWAIFSRPSKVKTYFNIAIAASITGAARSILLRALAVARDPIYCDTDSIIALDLPLDISSADLGAWKIEMSGNEIAIAGKKLYVVYQDGKPIQDERGRFKKASKGARLTPDEIMAVAKGGRVTFRNPVPKFNFANKPSFITRAIRSTAQISGRVVLGQRQQSPAPLLPPQSPATPESQKEKAGRVIGHTF